MKLGMDVCDPCAEGKAAVTRERPGLAGSGDIERHGASKDEDEEKNAERVESGSGYGVAEDVEERVFGGVVEGIVNGCNAEEVGDEED